MNPSLVVVVLVAAAASKDSLLALSKQEHTLSVIDPVTLKVLGRAPVGDDPHEVIASTDGKTAYVSNYGGGSLHSLAVIDLVNIKALPSIELGPLTGPHGLTFVAGKVWFTAEGAKVIGSYDPAAQKVDWVLGTGQDRTHMIYVSSDATWMVTTNVSSATVTLVEETKRRPMGPPAPGAGGPGGPVGPPPGAAGPPGGPPHPDFEWSETVIPVGPGSEGFDLSPDGKEIWVANAGDGTVSIIDRATKGVIETVAANTPHANRLKLTPDGKRAFISCLGGNDVVVFDTRTRKEVKRIAIGHGAAGIVMAPNGSRAFVAATRGDEVLAIDLKSLQVVGHIDAGKEPDGLAWAVTATAR